MIAQDLEGLVQKLVDAIDRNTDELRAKRELDENCAGAKINEHNLKVIEAMTGGGVIGATIVPPGGGPPQRGPRGM